MTDLDQWIAGVDQLLDGQRADPAISDDAMRWSPEPPAVGRPPTISEFVRDYFAYRGPVAPPPPPDSATDPLGRLISISRHHCRTAGFRVHLNRETFDQLRAAAQYPADPRAGSADTLFGIPVVVEQDAPWAWQLRRGDQVIESWPPQVFGYPAVVDWVLEYESETETWTTLGSNEHPPTTGPAHRFRARPR